jgi:hypothetical protein
MDLAARFGTVEANNPNQVSSLRSETYEVIGRSLPAFLFEGAAPTA